MKKAILPIILGYLAMIMLSGCKTSNDELNSNNVINSDILSESSSFQSSVTTSSSSKCDETNSSSRESRDENNSSNAPDINNLNTSSGNNNSQTDVPSTSNPESNETNFQPSSSNNNVLEPGKVEIIDGLLELKRDGQARGEIEAGMKIDCGKATLTKDSNVTFNVDCKQKLANIKITLTDGKTGKQFGGDVVGKGEISLDIDADGEYVVTIENCYDKATYFTIEYHISDKANTI